MNLRENLLNLVDERLRRVGEVVLQAQRDALSDSGSSDVHSRPGEAPRSQSGRLANSWSFEVRDGRLVLSSSCPYAKTLQEGTAKIAPRDVLAGYRNVKSKIIDIMKGRA